MTPSPEEKRKLVEFFGENGAAVVLAHIGELDSTFGSASLIIGLIMHGKVAPEASTA